MKTESKVITYNSPADNLSLLRFIKADEDLNGVWGVLKQETKTPRDFEGWSTDCVFLYGWCLVLFSDLWEEYQKEKC